MIPFSIAANLLLPGDSGLPPDQIPFTGSGSANSAADSVLNLRSAGSQSVSLGTIGAPGVIGLLIKMDPISGSGGAPVYATINGGSQPLEISPGGGILYFNPVPVSGITSITVAWSVNCVVRVWALG